MSTCIQYGEQQVWVSNQRLSSLLAFALQVATAQVHAEQEQLWLDKLRQFDAQRWPGIDFDLDEQFPDVEEKKFWARVYHDVARRIFLRQLGNYEFTFWQSSAIGDAHAIARMLTQSVCQVELGWHAETEDKREADNLQSQKARQTKI